MRISLQKDQNDLAKLRHGKAIHEGHLPDTFVKSYFPYFFTREGATMSLNGTYRKGCAFLIAGGPSFAKVDASLLSSVWVMTLNNAATSYRGQASCTVDDPSKFSLSVWLDPKIQKFVPMAHFEKPLWDNRYIVNSQRWEKSDLRVGDCPNVVGFRRNEKFFAPRWLHEDTINWGNHKKYGGGRSVLLAALRILHLLGFRRIYLLGVDFEMSATKGYHFDEKPTESSIRGNNKTYTLLQQCFSELQPYFLKDGFIVQNCNLASRLTAFPAISYEAAIAEASQSLGDVKLERTHGMYKVIDEKLGVKKEKPPAKPMQERSSPSDKHAHGSE